jgi:hypothetical protein
MSGGIAIALMMIIVVVAIVVGVISYLTGGIVWLRRTGTREDEPRRDRKPEHTQPTSPAQDHTAFVGTPRGDRARERDRGARES